VLSIQLTNRMDGLTNGVTLKRVT